MFARFIIILGLLAALAPSSRDLHAAQAIPVDGVAARVNKRTITVGEVMNAMQAMERQLRTQYTGRELVNRLEQAYERVLQALIEQALILEEFDRLQGAIPPQLVDEHIQSIISDSFNGDRGELLTQLAREGMTMEEWRRILKDQIAVTQLRRQEVLPKVVVSPRQVRDAYEHRQKDFAESAQVHVRMIVLAASESASLADQRVLAEELRERALAGEDFAELAREHSQDTQAARGGDWGWIEPSILRPELAAVVDTLKRGGISDIVEASEALWLVKLEDRKPARVRPFAEVQDELTEDIRRAEEERIYQGWINRLRNQFFVQTYDRTSPDLGF